MGAFLAMMCVQEPEAQKVCELLKSWQDEPLSYEARLLEKVGHSGFMADVHQVRLGSGAEVYQRACAALDAWEMFPPWAVVRRQAVNGQSGQEVGQIVAMVTCICGLWWVNPCRILQRCDSEHTHGFVYGTLPEHTECGEEQFVIEQHPDGSVWYVIRAFSRPRHWMAWIGFPLARWWQCRFVRDSQAGMVKKVANSQPLL